MPGKTPMQRMNEASAAAAELLLEEMQEVRKAIPRDKGRADMLAKLGGVLAELRIGQEPPDWAALMRTGITVGLPEPYDPKGGAQ